MGGPVAYSGEDKLCGFAGKVVMRREPYPSLPLMHVKDESPRRPCTPCIGGVRALGGGLHPEYNDGRGGAGRGRLYHRLTTPRFSSGKMAQINPHHAEGNARE